MVAWWWCGGICSFTVLWLAEADLLTLAHTLTVRLRSPHSIHYTHYVTLCVGVDVVGGLAELSASESVSV